MTVKMKISPTLYHFAEGQNVVEVNGSTIGECLKDLVAKFPDLEKNLLNQQGVLHEYLEIYVNRVRVNPGSYDGYVKDGDELYIIPVIDGG